MEQDNIKAIQANSVNQLFWEGKIIEPGQKICYFVGDCSRKISKRVIPIQIAKVGDKYDVDRYFRLLNDCCKSLIEPFADFGVSD